LGKFAVPYVLCTLLAVIFNTLNLALLAPLLMTLFESSGPVQPVEPDSWRDVLGYLNYFAMKASFEYGAFGALRLVCIVILVSVLLANVFRYLSQRIMENLRIYTLLNLRKSVFNNVMNLHVGFF